jgi:hypothetical protein
MEPNTESKTLNKWLERNPELAATIDEIERTWDDRLDGRPGWSWWAYTKPGHYVADMGLEFHLSHEDNVADLIRMLKSIEPCDCAQCLGQLDTGL